LRIKQKRNAIRAEPGFRPSRITRSTCGPAQKISGNPDENTHDNQRFMANQPNGSFFMESRRYGPVYKLSDIPTGRRFREAATDTTPQGNQAFTDSIDQTLPTPANTPSGRTLTTGTSRRVK